MLYLLFVGITQEFILCSYYVHTICRLSALTLKHITVIKGYKLLKYTGFDNQVYLFNTLTRPTYINVY